MAKATSLAHRELIVSLKKQGHSIRSISEQLDIRFSTVRDIWTAYRKKGESGLQTNYENCGKKKPDSSDLFYRVAIYLKRHHALWGSPYIHAIMKERYGEDIPSIRTLNRWYRALHLNKARRQLESQQIGKSTAVHNIWQVDAKERLELADGQKACYLSIVDEKSGSWLSSIVFPLWLYLSGTY